MILRLLCILALTGCTAHSKPQRPRVALQNVAWLAGGAGLVGLGYWTVRDAREDGGGLGGPIGVAIGATGGVMMFGAILGLLGVAFDDVPDQ